MDADQIRSLLKQLSELGEKASNGEQNARMGALQLSRKLSNSLEKPENVAVNLAFSPFVAVAARIAVDLNLFKLIVDHGSPITSVELATLSGGEELLIVRILRPLASLEFVKEVDNQTWIATPVTKAMATEEIAAGHRMVGEMVVGAAHKAPNYLREAGYRCPTDAHDGLMQYAFQTKLTTFELFISRPRVLKDFNTFMGNTMGARKYWVDWFPVNERLLDNVAIAADSPLLVDVGAGKGHDLLAFRSKYPHIEGRLILQDLAPVISSIQVVDPAIELMIYDFFTEQPVTDARAYFYHHILHDWSDAHCLTILSQVKKAMRPGYSKLLLHEMIIPETGAPLFHAMLNITMMAFNGGMERTQRQWQLLLEKAGLKVVRFWPPLESGADGIIEAMSNE
ncbi:sterigmatocystin 8-O-methyltransferase [Biscogniauxia mediterranea]|nr:sterigmatocystin 8-O-methyltransferase [Biscogniauxia mediterranea]